MPRPLDPAMYGIRDNGSGTGWVVAFVRRGASIQRSFHAERHGGMAGALAAAQAWRDDTALQTPATTLQQYSEYLRRNNTSGRPGVHRIERVVRLKGGGAKTHVFWMARSPDGVRPSRSRSFAISRYGEEGAYERAVAAREGFVHLLEGYLLPSVPRALHPSAHEAIEPHR